MRYILRGALLLAGLCYSLPSLAQQSAPQSTASSASQDPREALSNEIRGIKGAGEDISIVAGRIALSARLLGQEFDTVNQAINAQITKTNDLQGKLDWWEKCNQQCLEWVAHSGKGN